MKLTGFEIRFMVQSEDYTERYNFNREGEVLFINSGATGTNSTVT